MNGRRWVVLVCALGIGRRCSQTAAAARPQQQQPAGGEIGVTADTIRIAVIADVDNAARPGLFQGSVDGVNAFAKFVNANGGLAGAKLPGRLHRLEAERRRGACAGASVPGGLRHRRHDGDFMNNIEPMTSCVDQAGKATGLPDVPVLQTEIAHSARPSHAR